jgi:hypothetical protein
MRLFENLPVKTLGEAFDAYLDFAEEFESALSLALMYVEVEHRTAVSLFLSYRALKHYEETDEPLPTPIVEWFMIQIPHEVLERAWLN